VPALLDNVLVFGRVLRTVGMEVHLGRLLDVADALQHVDLGARADVHHTCRALLVHRRDDLATFDRAFDAFWRAQLQSSAEGSRRSSDPRSDRPAPSPAPHPGDPGDAAHLGAALAEVTSHGDVQTWSDAQTLRHKDFAEYTTDEVAVARAAMARLAWGPGERRTRRWVAGEGPRLDLRRALARSVRTDGDVFTWPHRRRRLRERPLVVLCDVSGSMERYSRMLVHFAHALARRQRRLEVFVFSTELTRVTRELASRRLDVSAREVSLAAPHWSGGTRIGEVLREFQRHWRRRVLPGGAVVLLVSDGWDRGDPLLLRDQVRRLQRSCHRLIWLNPLIGTTDYAPLTRGLQAALPYVDDFLPVRTLSNLADLALHLNTLSGRTNSDGHRRHLHV
jgi:uncharacterized protein with von Willebrand factor type A (vWA) domain